jgi:hypothetical protein
MQTVAARRGNLLTQLRALADTFSIRLGVVTEELMEAWFQELVKESVFNSSVPCKDFYLLWYGCGPLYLTLPHASSRTALGLREAASLLEHDVSYFSRRLRKYNERLLMRLLAIAYSTRKGVNELEYPIALSECIPDVYKDRLIKGGIHYIGDLVTKSEAELMKIPNVGSVSLRRLLEALARTNLHIGMELKHWPTETITRKRF